jgi:hypothetical protein
VNGDALQTRQADFRRLRIASLYLRGLSPHEIVLALPKNGIIDPTTRLPYSLDVVQQDILTLEDQWETEQRVAPKMRRARVLAELHEAKRAAWAKGDLGTVVRCLKQEAELFELDAVPDDDEESLLSLT